MVQAEQELERFKRDRLSSGTPLTEDSAYHHTELTTVKQLLNEREERLARFELELSTKDRTVHLTHTQNIISLIMNMTSISV